MTPERIAEIREHEEADYDRSFPASLHPTTAAYLGECLDEVERLCGQVKAYEDCLLWIQGLESTPAEVVHWIAAAFNGETYFPFDEEEAPS